VEEKRQTQPNASIYRYRTDLRVNDVELGSTGILKAVFISFNLYVRYINLFGFQ
jgi:hypothetical protein